MNASAEGRAARTGEMLVYDGDCPLCVGAVNVLARTGLVARDTLRPYQDLEGEVAEVLWDAGIRNEMAAYDPASGRVWSGVRALLHAMRVSRLGPVVRVLELPPITALLSLGYRLVSYNRRILAPREPGTVRCACDPDFHAGYRIGLIAILLATAVALTLLLGVTLPLRADPASAVQSATDMLAAAGSGWVAAMLLALRLPFERYVTWLGHLAVTMNVGLLVQVPGMLLSLVLDGPALVAVQVLSMLASFTVMLRMQVRRARIQALGAGWVALWVVCLALLPPVMLCALGSL